MITNYLLLARFSLLTLFFSLTLTNYVFSQTSPKRYLEPVFDSIHIDSSVIYGNNLGIVTGILEPQDLEMDVYLPMNDTMIFRPLIILIPTGNLMPRVLNKSPEGTMRDSANVELASRWAKRGFVVASISHRLGWVAVGDMENVRTTYAEALYRAIQDANTCVRYFKKHAAENGNTYGVDVDKITVGGLGSGGNIALGAAYLDDPKELNVPNLLNNMGQPYIEDFLLGDIEAKDSAVLSFGNIPNYSSDFGMVFSIGGAIVNTEWIEAGDIPSVAFHVPEDPRVPYEKGEVRVPFSNDKLFEVEGGLAISKRSLSLGNQDIFMEPAFSDVYTMKANLKNEGIEGLYPFIRPLPVNGEIYDCQLPGQITLPRQAEHNPWSWWNEAQFIADWDSLRPDENISGAIANCNERAANPDMSAEKGRTYIDTVLNYLTPRIVRTFGLPTKVDDKIDFVPQISIYPNPITQYFMIESTDPKQRIQTVKLYNLQGELVWDKEGLSVLQIRVEIPKLVNGMYLLAVHTQDGMANQKVWVKRND